MAIETLAKTEVILKHCRLYEEIIWGNWEAKELKIRECPKNVKGFEDDTNTITFTHINNSVEN